MSSSTCIVSSAYLGIRKDRKDDYYTRHLGVLRRSRLPVQIHSQTNIPGCNVISNPDELILEFWPEKNWWEIYHDLLVKNKDQLRAVDPRWHKGLIAAWLSKFIIMKRTLDKFESVLWIDSGYCNKIANFFNAGRLSSSGLSKKCYIREAIEKFGGIVLNGVTWEPRNLHLDDEIMFNLSGKYNAKNLPTVNYKGAFMFVRRGEFEGFLDGVRKKWLDVINTGVPGTEENALTLLGWEKNLPYLSYDAWTKLL